MIERAVSEQSKSGAIEAAGPDAAVARAAADGPDAVAGADAGRVLGGRFRVVRRLGVGGMAAVFLAEDERLGRRVAVKRLHTERPEQDAARFAREARLGASLNHPNLVTVFDTISDEESVLIVMEYVAGADLGRELKRGTLDRERGLSVLGDVASALDHAHQRGIVHRDVKPSNILLREDGVAKLADLGIARALEDTAITQSGVVMGTVLYMAPEQLEGKESGGSADVYSLALIAYEVTSGRRARSDGTVPEVTFRVATQSPPDLREACPDISDGAAEVLKRGMDRDPSRRPRSASALVRDFTAALEVDAAGTGVAAFPTTVAAPIDEPTPVSEHAVLDRPAPHDHEVAPVVEELPKGADEEPAPTYGRPARAGNRRLPALAALALAAAVAAIAIIVLASGGGDGGGTASHPSAAAGKASAGGGSSAGGASQPANSSASAGAAAAPSGSPQASIQSFYDSAANGDYRGAWGLASSSFRSQLQGYDAFAAQQSSLESVKFTSLDVTNQTPTSAEVSFSDVATHTSYTDRCTGSFSLVLSGDTWLIDSANNISCNRS